MHVCKHTDLEEWWHWRHQCWLLSSVSSQMMLTDHTPVIISCSGLHLCWWIFKHLRMTWSRCQHYSISCQSCLDLLSQSPHVAFIELFSQSPHRGLVKSHLTNTNCFHSTTAMSWWWHCHLLFYGLFLSETAPDAQCLVSSQRSNMGAFWAHCKAENSACVSLQVIDSSQAWIVPNGQLVAWETVTGDELSVFTWP